MTRSVLTPHACERCGVSPVGAWTVSMFNTQQICMTCKQTERLHPDYAHAHDTECEAVKAGDRNFPGVGLPADLAGGGTVYDVTYKCPSCNTIWQKQWSRSQQPGDCPGCGCKSVTPLKEEETNV